MSDERPLETGWLVDTPVGDNIVRRFLHNQSDVNAQTARAAGGRAEQWPAVTLADTGGPIVFLNQALLLQPLAGADDPVLDQIEAFYPCKATGRPALLLSAWPTPDLRLRGWSLMGHPTFMLRGPSSERHVPKAGVAVQTAADPADLALAERIAVEAWPMPEAAGLPPGALFPPALLGAGPVLRLGLLDGHAVATASCSIGHGVVNLCFATTLPSARRRGVWEALVRARLLDAPHLPAVAFTSDDSRPGFERMGFLPILRLTLWVRSA